MLFGQSQFLQAYKEVKKSGEMLNTKHGLVLELRDYKMQIDSLNPFTSFEARKMNLSYMIHEFLWYMRGNKFDDSIEKHATLWKKIKTHDGSFNSNYGHYWVYRGGIDWVVSKLLEDKMSRQACISHLGEEHYYDENPDFVCTYATNFCIRQNQLHLTVCMRSNDAIYGLTNDAFCFSLLHQLVWNLLKKSYPDLQLGKYTHIANSFHVYQRHFDMLEQLCEQGSEATYLVKMPTMTELDAEIFMLLADTDYDELITNLRVPNKFNDAPMVKWMLSIIGDE